MANRSVDFFEEQFQRQVRAHEFSLNPFEAAALPYLSGRVLDLACGIGNLAEADEEVQKRAGANSLDNFSLAMKSKLRDAIVDRLELNEAIATRYLNEHWPSASMRS